VTDQLVEAIVEMRDDEAVAIARDRIASGTDPIEILAACRDAMAEVGNRFESGEYFVPELILAGEVLRSISELVKPFMTGASAQAKKARIVLGTVAGDIHDIGKDIVFFMLDVNGFEVIDLGVDVPVQTFVDKVGELKPQIVALSGFLTLAYDSMRDTVRALEAAGLRSDVKIMIGGGVVDEQVRAFTGADAFGLDAMAAVNLAKGWSEAA
jgi:5-methyltetrahydrofolate--homocysteine methyltransferase